MSVYEVDATTGEATERPMTPEEQATHEQGQGESAAALAAAQWLVVDSVRGQQLRDTDWMIEPFPADTTDSTQAAIKANEQGWLDFRQGLRDITHDGDPSALVWPTPPPEPQIVITSPPDFVDSSAWPPEHVPTP